VTLSDDPEADLFLAADPNALLLGVLYDSQYSTRKAFAAPLRLKERLGHLDIAAIAVAEPETIEEAFRRKPALHRFPSKFASLTQHFAREITERYEGDCKRIWKEAADVDDLASRLMNLPAFGEQKVNWTIGMLGRLNLLHFAGWEDYRVEVRVRKRA
jgi:uncharacterized HhH-GPD family protein